MGDDILNRLVNRGTQHANFMKMLDGTTSRRIMTITAPAGMGKSWLLHSFVHEVRRRELPYALIDFSDRQGYDSLTLMRRFRDELGTPDFDHFTMSIQKATTPHFQISDSFQDSTRPTVNFADTQLGDVSIQDVAGKNIIKNNLFYMRVDSDLARQTVEDQICSAFFVCLRTLSQVKPVVFLLDTYDRLSRSTTNWEGNSADDWIRGELLRRILSGELTNVIVILAGRYLPNFDHRWATVIGHISVSTLELNDVEEYLTMRLGLQDITSAEAQLLYKASNGVPQLLGVLGDNLVRIFRPDLQDEIWC